jgi:hypothetical protein
MGHHEALPRPDRQWMVEGFVRSAEKEREGADMIPATY